ncbi:MAG: Hsp70 family protein [Alphaproteobacteria bacterium]|nr:Hsp70 family protein [Alphaproteobacteria bacterium]
MYLGIDLGSSNSVVAGIVDGKARVFRPADGGEVLPSVIYFDKRGHRLYGRRAHDQALVAPENVAAGFKRLMGSSTPIEIKDLELKLTPEECSAEIIRQLLGQAATESGGDRITGAVITIPAAFNQMQSESTLRAAKMAGLDRVDLLQEPIAAAMAAMEGAKRSGRFLVYDLGGGTFDVALAQAINGEVKIVAHQGINMLGGRDFDRMIVNEVVRPWLAATFDLPENFQRDPNYRRLIRIAQLAAEKAKIDLSSQDEAAIFASDDELRMMDQNEMEMYLDVPFTRARFEELIREPVMQTIDLIRSLLADNNTSHEEIDRIVFIGGPSRIPLIRQMVSNELGIAADLKTDPMTAVAVGAAYYCEGRQWDADNVSSPKPKEAVVEAPKSAPASVPAVEDASVPAAPVISEPGVSYAYTARTPSDKTVVTVQVKGNAETRQIKLIGKGWDSGALPLFDGLTISVPLADAGEHMFTAHVLDEAGNVLPQHDQALAITRLVASTGSIPAAQTIAVKALGHMHAQENILMPLVRKGDTLPAHGRVRFTTARGIKAHEFGSVSFELFQVEYPERVDLNLCVGVFRIGGEDLPDGFALPEGSVVTFDWTMSDSGILQATAILEGAEGARLEHKAPRFYAPQAGQISFAGEGGAQFASAIIRQGEEEWGDLAAAVGPEGGPEMQLLKMRIQEQSETLAEAGNDPETIRRVAEESRFVRQDIARLAKKYRAAMLQRRLGKMNAVFNRIARAHADKPENARFDNHAVKVQGIIDAADVAAYEDADLHLAEMRDLFFFVAWRDAGYVQTWFKRLAGEPYLFPDAAEFKDMVAQGQALAAADDIDALRQLVKRMLSSRIALGASDSASELATIVKA